MAFMPFITAGDPDLDFTVDMIRELSKQGADLIEIGFPYSDPIADGPVIQSSYTRAMNHGITVEQIFESLKTLNDESIPPMVGMVSFAIIYRLGMEAFVEKAKASGLSGLIVPDLPADQAKEFSPICQAGGLDLVQLLSPTSSEERAKNIVETSSGFVYCIAVAGITGERENVANELLDQLTWLRTQTELPLCVGFGISKAKHVDPLRGKADGVIVGSALVRFFEELADDPTNETKRKALLEKAGESAGTISQAAHQSK